MREGNTVKRQYLLCVMTISLISTIILSGCSIASQSTSATNISNSSNAASSKNGSVDNTGVTSNQTPRANPLFNTTLTLPNGQIITPDHPIKWKEVSILLQILSLPSHTPRYGEILDNHSTMLSHTYVSTSAGTATFILNERTPPAAAQSTVPTYEYWVIVYGSQYAYAIDATVTGDRTKAKGEVMELLHNWKVPQ